MSFIQRRYISTVRFLNNTYSSSKSSLVKAYVNFALINHCRTSGLDALGAEIAEIRGGAHIGGHFPAEPFHITFNVLKADGTYIGTQNPHNGRFTYSHHFYIASSQLDFEDRVIQWAGGSST